MNDAEMLELLRSAREKYMATDLAPAIKELEQRLADLLPSPFRKIVLVDFDGVLHSYTSGWTGAASVVDDPLPGAIRWLESLVRNPRLDVRIFSARCNDPNSHNPMRTWLVYHGFPGELLDRLKFQSGKPKAHLIIDDRAVQFQHSGHNTSYIYVNYAMVENFEPWYYKHAEWKRK